MKYIWNFLIGVLAFLACFAIDKWILPRSVFHKTDGVGYLKQVNQSLNTSNAGLNLANKQLLQSMQTDMMDPLVAEKMKQLFPKALQVFTFSAEVYRYVETERDALLAEAAKYSYPASSNRAPERLFIKQGKGDRLRIILDQYKKNLLAIDPGIKTAFENNLPIIKNMAEPDNKKQKDWARDVFDNKTTLQAEIILNRIMNDISTSEQLVLTYLETQTGKPQLAFDKF